MVRKATQLLVLPLLLALLAAGGNATMCEVLSLVGLDGHHHAYHEGGETCHPGPLCLQSDANHEHENEQAPCPESCEIQISEAPAPLLIQLPPVAETLIVPFLAEIPDAALLLVSVLQIAEEPEPPNNALPSIDPIFTGRFLV